MARIRTIKPEFFRHEELQDLERDKPGLHIMLVFAGLFGHCDKNGVFAYKPRMLKLDILPFLDFDMAATLAALVDHGFVQPFEDNEKSWGFIPTFTEHQRLQTKELNAPTKYPEPPKPKEGRTGDVPGTHPEPQEGKGREEEGNVEGNGQGNPEVSPDAEPDLTSEAAERFNALAKDLSVPLVQKLTASRRAALRARIKDCGGLDGWDIALGKVRESPFLSGQKTDFRITFDWLVKAANFVKVMEGNYDRDDRKPPPDDGGGFAGQLAQGHGGTS